MNNSTGKIWTDEGELSPITFVDGPYKDLAIIIVNRNRKDLTDSLCKQMLKFAEGSGFACDLFVVDIGSETANVSDFTTISYEDNNFRGKCYAHNVGLRQATLTANYRYYWVMMNDIQFDDSKNCIEILLSLMDGDEGIGLISPTNIGVGSGYQGASPCEGQTYRKVPVCDYLALLFRSDVIRSVGFLNPDFKFCWGAIHELSNKIYRTKKWFIAYCDIVSYEHLGGTTYGQTQNVVSRVEYVQSAKKFAARYFVEHYGKNWDVDFERDLPGDITQKDIYTAHRNYWQEALSEVEVAAFETKNEFTLEDKIFNLNPWYYPVIIGDIKVVPGIGSFESSKDLVGRATYMEKLWIHSLAKKFNFSGKSILDIACNCGYWSSQLVTLGASRFLGVEGRFDIVKQGELYWSYNKFLADSDWQFLHGNVTDVSTWEKIRELAPFSFTLCCGILYHIPDYEKLLEFLRSVTTEAMLVDTRVEHEELFVQEPGGWKFDAITETSYKKVPSLRNLVSKLESLGFELEQLTINDAVPDGLMGKDDYSTGARVAFLAKLKH